MTTMSIQGSKWASASSDRALVGILVFSVGVTHCLVLLNDGIYWDDWLTYTDLVKRDWSTLGKLASERGGIPQDFAYWGSFAFFPGITEGWKLVAFICICASAILIFKLGVNSALVTRSQAFWIALLASTYPVFQTWILLGTSQYILYYTLFLAGWLLALKALSAPDRQWLWWPLAFVALLVAFRLNSLLVLHFGFLTLLVVSRRGSPSALRSRIVVLSGLFVLPFAYWLVNGLFKPYGLYAHYNAFALERASLLSSAKQFWTYSVLHVNVQSFLTAGWQFLPWTLVLIAAGLVVFPSLDRRSRSGLFLFGCGLIGLVLGSLPYVLVGDSPADGWRGRHGLLLALPMAMVIVGSLTLLSATGNASASVAKVVVILISVGYALSTVNIYVAWEYRAIKDQAVMAKVAADPTARTSSVFWINDQFRAGPESHYRFYEWSAMFWHVYGDQSRIGFDTNYYSRTDLESFGAFYTSGYDLATFDPNGCQANLTIRPGPAADNVYRLVAEYTLSRFLAPDHARDLVERSAIVSVTTVPRLPDQQTDCISSP